MPHRPPEQPAAPPALALHRVCKRFGAIVANHDLSFAVAPGTIHGLIGENGAGKSTAMNIVFGAVMPDGGRLQIDGRAYAPRRPADALAAGIGMVHQHFHLVEDATVLDNLLLGAEGGFRLGPGRRQLRRALAAFAALPGLAVPPDAVVADLPVALRQRVEVLRVLIRGARLLILDEPTALLTPDESRQLFALLETLRDGGTTILLVSHRLREILAVTQRVTVLRRGTVVADLPTAAATLDQLAAAMIGRPAAPPRQRTQGPPGRPRLVATNLTVRDDRGIVRLSDLTFTLRSGEILGVAGVAGNGQAELLEAVAGLRPVTSGKIQLVGSPDEPAPTLAHVPEDRLAHALIAGFPAADNALLGRQNDRACGGGTWLNHRAVETYCRALMARHDVRPAEPQRPIGRFSGGNQQKLVLARAFDRDPALLLVAQPTRGVDLGAVEVIHDHLLALRERGKAIMLVSADLEELLILADRLLILSQGRMVGLINRAEADPARIGRMMSGESDLAAKPNCDTLAQADGRFERSVSCRTTPLIAHT